MTSLHLNKEQQAMLDGEFGYPRRWAMQHMLQVGQFFDAKDLVEVTQAHMMADTESLGIAGVELIEQFASYPKESRLVKIPTITDPSAPYHQFA